MDRDWKDIKKELLSNPEVKAEYDNLGKASYKSQKRKRHNPGRISPESRN